MKQRLLYLSLIIFIGMLGVSWLTHGTGVVVAGEHLVERSAEPPGVLGLLGRCQHQGGRGGGSG